ncbi:protein STRICTOSIDINE SYNTHASE-LIKE 5-like [Diospyros lotus]|uniref:protein STRICTOSIDINE SYNTHASE-LIKE 5-like n=1 Tax=Diospyros lotus TaxID=55363 RepID=UPI0022592AE2|nr:protein STRICTOSIDINE SYNTHASE-LIKE 5-like [Diospyros lotus]
MSPSSSEPTPPSSSPSSSKQTTRRRTLWPSISLLSALAPLLSAAVFYQLFSFDPAPLPTHELARRPILVPSQNPRMLRGAELIGAGQLPGPEELAYDPKSGLLYTGCADGWIKRVTVMGSAADARVENWVNTGGRPLGLVLGGDDEVIVADADKGLLKVRRDGAVELLTDEAEGVKFKLTDGVDMAKNGVIYFTDASHKYSLTHFIWDILEGRPHGRLLSFDPSTRKTHLLLSDLYFPNGVAVSPDQLSVVFCETPMRRCRKYFIEGEGKGSVGNLVENLPGMPDNIHYDEETGYYWIAIAAEASFSWDMAQRYPFIRKCLAMMERYIGRPNMEKNSGILGVDKDGKPVAFYLDPKLAMLSSGIKVADHLYAGSVVLPYIIRLNLTEHPAKPII